MIDVILLVIGFALLFISGHYLVMGGVELAKFFKIPTLVVGLTIVSFGTSAPELLVSLKAAFSGYPDISLGNVVGSNISNIALVLGITALICPIPVATKLLKSDWPIMILLSLLLFVFSLSGLLTWWHGAILLLILIYFNVNSIIKGRSSDEVIPVVKIPWYYAILIIIASSVGLVFGAEWLVKGATGIARGLGVGERIISVSIIAFGTSVPELATSVVAAIKRQTDISIGNIIGSNVFNIAGILGITAVTKAIPVNQDILYNDMIWMIAISVLLFLLMVGKSRKISKLNGIMLISAYGLYLFFLLSN